MSDPKPRRTLSYTRDDMLKRRMGLFNDFRNAGTPFTIIFPDADDVEAGADPGLGWLNAHFSFHVGGRIDWTHADDLTEFREDHQGAREWLSAEVGRRGLGDPRVWIVWADAGTPTIAMALADALAWIDPIFEQDFWDCWVFDPEDDWCIEYDHEGMVVVGRSTEATRAGMSGET